jgi:hypothetical protein
MLNRKEGLWGLFKVVFLKSERVVIRVSLLIARKIKTKKKVACL